MDFDSLEKKDIQNLVVEGNDLQLLYRLDIWLERKESTSYNNLNKETDPSRKGAIKNTLSWATNLHDICKKREEDLKENNNAFNARFRAEAQRVLTPEQYAKIAEAAKR